jgi:hypothetical protein
MFRIGAIVAVAMLGACETPVVESRGQMREGVFSCESDTLPAPVLMINSDGAYELRWRDTQNHSATGWIEQGADGMRPTSGPLEGALLTWTADGGVQATGATAINVCRALQS